MRCKITAVTQEPCLIPYNYQYHVKSALYKLFEKSDAKFSDFLHNVGYKYDDQYRFKHFTFSRLNFFPYHTNKEGFFLVKKISFIFSTAVEKSFEHLMYGIFPDAELLLNFGKKLQFKIVNVEILEEPYFIDDKQSFVCLSPIVVSTQRINDGKKGKHFLNYLKDEEKKIWINNLKINLIKKHKTLTDILLPEDIEFNFRFEADYISKSKSSIMKMTKINQSKVLGLFAPFNLTCSSELKKTAFDTGLGEQNSSGFGCFDLKKK